MINVSVTQMSLSLSLFIFEASVELVNRQQRVFVRLLCLILSFILAVRMPKYWATHARDT